MTTTFQMTTFRRFSRRAAGALVLSAAVTGLAACAARTGSAKSDSPASEGRVGNGARMEPSARYLKRGETRNFDVTYTGQVKDIPAGTQKLRVWMPVPQDSPVQKITNLKFDGPQPKITFEPKHGNKIAYYEIDNPGATASFPMSFRVSRQELLTDLSALKDGRETDPDAHVFLYNDRLTFVDDRVRGIAQQVTAGKTTTVDKSRAIYNHVLGHMTYDKNHTGWGAGDTNHACDVGKGNCTDFHALFMSLARASDIPAGFEIGLYLPYERKVEKPGGYHCWSYFRVPGQTWVPIDASEADRFPERKEYFFGNHTANRVGLSTGRDITFVPAQQGAPVNYFLNPYAEADGASVTTSKDWNYTDLDVVPAAK